MNALQLVDTTRNATFVTVCGRTFVQLRDAFFGAVDSFFLLAVIVVQFLVFRFWLRELFAVLDPITLHK